MAQGEYVESWGRGIYASMRRACVSVMIMVVAIAIGCSRPPPSRLSTPRVRAALPIPNARMKAAAFRKCLGVYVEVRPRYTVQQPGAFNASGPGTADLLVYVGTTGQPFAVETLSASSVLYAAASINMVSTWSFTPATCDGKSLLRTFEVHTQFSLRHVGRSLVVALVKPTAIDAAVSARIVHGLRARAERRLLRELMARILGYSYPISAEIVVCKLRDPKDVVERSFSGVNGIIKTSAAPIAPRVSARSKPGAVSMIVRRCAQRSRRRRRATSSAPATENCRASKNAVSGEPGHDREGRDRARIRRGLGRRHSLQRPLSPQPAFRSVRDEGRSRRPVLVGRTRADRADRYCSDAASSLCGEPATFTAT